MNMGYKRSDWHKKSIEMKKSKDKWLRERWVKEQNKMKIKKLDKNKNEEESQS